MIEYISNLENLNSDMLYGFFVGWPNPPSQKVHMKILGGSYCVWLAIDSDTNQVVGFINAISDGIMAAYIPLLEVLPEYQNKGIGTNLITRMLDSLNDLYMVDVLCDEDVLGFYTKLGMMAATGVCVRNYNRQKCE